MLKFNTHCHTLGASPCGAVTPCETADAYARLGYDGLIITNHYTELYFRECLKGATAEAKIKDYLRLYQEAKEYGSERGLSVYLGMELNLSRYNRAGNTYPVYEFLLFGMTEEFLFAHADLYAYSQEEAFEALDEAGILMIQAHPFRTRTRVADPFYEHGIELYNGHPEHDNHNDLAFGFVGAHPHLLRTAGDDYHRRGTEGYAGMYFPDGTRSMQDIVAALRDGTAGVFVTGKNDPTIVRKNH